MKAAKFRGHGCDVRATPATARHFFALDAEIGRIVASYRRKQGRSRAAGAAAGVWKGFRDLAGLCVAEKQEGRQTRVFTQTTR